MCMLFVVELEATSNIPMVGFFIQVRNIPEGDLPGADNSEPLGVWESLDTAL